MSKEQRLLTVYKEILDAAGCTYEDGCISRVLCGDTEPVLIDGKRLVLPTKDHLRASMHDNTEIFHPLNEHMQHGESKVTERLRSIFNNRLDYALTVLAMQLIKIGASPALQEKLNPDQADFLENVKGITGKTDEAFMKILRHIPADGNQASFVKLYVKKRGVVKGKNYRRAAIVSWPLYEELKKGEKKVFGVQIAEREQKTIISLIEYMIPNIETEGSYNVGSNSDVAPVMDALMRGVAGIADEINVMVDLFRNLLDEPDEIYFSTEWKASFDQLEDLMTNIKMIPNQATDSSSFSESDGEEIKPSATTMTSSPSPHAGSSHAGSGNVNDVKPWNQPPQPPQPQPSYPQQGMYPGMGRGPSYPGGVPASQVPHTQSGKLDFAALARSNPQQFGAAPSTYAQPLQNQPARRSSYYDNRGGGRPQYAGMNTGFTGSSGGYRRY